MLLVLSDEIETTMRLIGVTSLTDLNMNYLNVRDLQARITDTIEGPKARL